jgi:sugar transferase (PEP-CTERM/EpsH1 system associated)
MTLAMHASDPRPLIAHVVYRFDVGGLENGVVNLINRLSADRYRHAVVALTQITEFRRRIYRDDVQFLSLDKPPGQGIWQLPRLRRAFLDLRPSIVHTRNIGALEASLPALFAGVPARVHGEHGWDSADPDGNNWKHRLTRRAYRSTVQRWIALSSHIERYLRESVGVPATRLTRICNGVDTELFQPAPGARAPIAGSPFDDSSFWLVGTVGRLQTVKDQVNLVQAVAHAIGASSEARMRLRLAIIGDGPQRADVEAAIVATGLREHVWLAGSRDDVAGVLRGLDIFALPSRAEGISNTILESMASGLPIVATRVGGNSDLIDDGATGRLVPPSDPRALGDALLALFADPSAARRLGRAARVECERTFSLDRMVADYAAIYDQLLASRGIRPLAVAASGR